ncbi:sodium-dependent multivitamin transporter-like [Glandiceps talaboti]
MSSNDVTKFGAVDWVIFVAMLLVSTATGIYHAMVKGGQQTTSKYLVGGRSIPWIPIALSYFVSFTSSISVMGFPAEIYVHGIQFAFLLPGYVWGIMLVVYFFVPFIRTFNFISIYEYLSYRYHYNIRIIAVIFGTISATLFMSITITGPALAFKAIQGIDLWLTSLIIGIVCTFYTTLGGMKAVIWSDVFQFFVMTAAVIAVFILGIKEAGGMEHVLQYSEEQGKLHVDFSLDPTIRLTYFTMFIYGGFSMINTGVAQGSVQRFLSAKSVRAAQSSLLLTLPMFWLFYGTTMVIGLVLFTYYNNDIGSLKAAINTTYPPGMLPEGQMDSAIYEPDYTSADQIIVYFISAKLGQIPGIQGLFISCLFAGAMSSISSNLNAIAAMILRDIVKPWRHHRSKISNIPVVGDDAWDTKISKFISLVFGIVATSLSLAMPYLGTLVELGASFIGVFSGPIVGIYILGMYYPRSNTWGVFIGLLGSLTYGLATAISSTIGRTTGQPQPNALNITLYYHLPVNTLTMILVGLIASEIVRCISVEERTRNVNPALLDKHVRTKSPKEDKEDCAVSLVK